MQIQIVRSLLVMAATLPRCGADQSQQGKDLSLPCMKAFIPMGRIASPLPSLSLLLRCPVFPFGFQCSFCQFSFCDLLEKLTKMVLIGRMYILISRMSSFLLWLLTTPPFDVGACLSLESCCDSKALVP